MILKNQILSRAGQKPIIFDLFYKKTKKPKPLIIFCHGYKGFKDWGAWNLMAKAFMNADLFFVKLNFSHNGGTVENPIDFSDLEAFAENNYTKEIADLDVILTHCLSEGTNFTMEIDPTNVTVIGHSRGGGIAIIKASEDSRITKLITLASVCDFAKRTAISGDLDAWKKEGVKYVLNGRTKQQMPHNYQFYEDFKAHETRLNIEQAEKSLVIPHAIIHAIDDPSVNYKEAKLLKQWNPKATLISVENSDHVFGAKHPWHDERMPPVLKQITKMALSLIKD
ncbi:alpha/beta hydrolase [Lacinutrix neustonica]|uniref:Alpha/beta hydrolase n=1 Tax=Lacinutrix neustonica TaxID=2980107 RepID=A0A9E8MT34_9FLAO|nr:alpha/beta hydrolase [Lacinutrix neustonica]WAC00923.1 alpha/beta hydrolase [Lacinutrix neustonica]